MQERIHGLLLGMAVGDALGLPYENLSAKQARHLGPPDRMRLWQGRGMVSDDTELALLTVEALLKSSGDTRRFQKMLRRSLIGWGARLPFSAGQATLQAIVRLSMGFSPERSGVRSAGSGPLTRSLPLGLLVTDPERLRLLVRASTRITHTDIRAERAALVMAVAARFVLEYKNIQLHSFLEELPRWIPEEEDHELWGKMALLSHSLELAEDTRTFAQHLGMKQKVKGYVYDILPVVLHAWFSFPNRYKEAVQSVIALGGDTDTMAALVGGLVGIRVSADGIPPEWVDQLWEPLYSPAHLEWLSAVLAENRTHDLKRFSPTLKLMRQMTFNGVVMGHVLRRMLWVFQKSPKG